MQRFLGVLKRDRHCGPSTVVCIGNAAKQRTALCRIAGKTPKQTKFVYCLALGLYLAFNQGAFLLGSQRLKVGFG